MNMELKGTVAVVTGGAVRLGRAISLALAHEGAAVFIHYNRSAGPAEDLRDEIIAAGGTAVAGSGDLSDQRKAAEIIAAASDALGHVSVLVNSASGFPADNITNLDVDAWQSTMNLTLGSPLFLTQAFAAEVPADGSGAVVNITDIKTMRPYKEHLSYMLAKGGIDTLTRATALALAPNIRVNAVALGVILPPPGEGEEYVNALAAALPLQRAGGAQVVADTVVFLAKNDFITGEIIHLDGGALLT
jgi:NAD(P)-dependent dehydrogenase (short-subunit alcohol dehydrogenase family)